LEGLMSRCTRPLDHSGVGPELVVQDLDRHLAVELWVPAPGRPGRHPDAEVARSRRQPG
jgi:hypothetical protein